MGTSMLLLAYATQYSKLGIFVNLFFTFSELRSSEGTLLIR